ncbi:MAG: hypothetical protein JSV52_12430 [Candidatus Zixiibacteriota bacterium]|nr:MAG: hypothetical protein JSV52_12430 [candidate division Zixibacteria bacterium]
MRTRLFNCITPNILIVPGLIVTLILLTSCATEHKLRKEGPYLYDDDKKDIAEPASSNYNLVWDTFERSVFEQGDQFVNLDRNLCKLFGCPKQALNINSFDEVPNSTWFENRHGQFRMTPEEIRLGLTTTGGPDTSGEWTVFRPKLQGATVGFWIEDIHGNQYIIKFDPPGFPEMATAAAAMGSRFFHACGYNVPEETIVYWKPHLLRIKEGVTYTDNAGQVRPLTVEVLDEVLENVERSPDGYIRSLASLALKNVKGPFSYDGTRKDDPNDWCKHQHRRELRGLYVMASLINHYDTKDQNTLDAYEEEDGRCFLRHYLIDFGSTFGSDGDKPKPAIKGYANFFDIRDIFVSLITLGLKTWSWEYAEPYEYPSIGYFESKLFKPHKFDPIFPNPAFDEMTGRDAYWGAKIVMAFRDDDLRALVDAGQFSDPEAAEYLFNTLKERRDKIGRHWFSKVNPLDHFSASYNSPDFRIAFEDLAVKYGLETESDTRYRHSVKYDGRKIISKRALEDTELLLTSDDLDQMASYFAPPEKDGDSDNFLYEILIETQRSNQRWSKPTRLWLWYFPDERQFKLVGIEHLD